MNKPSRNCKLINDEFHFVQIHRNETLSNERKFSIIETRLRCSTIREHNWNRLSNENTNYFHWTSCHTHFSNYFQILANSFGTLHVRNWTINNTYAELCSEFYLKENIIIWSRVLDTSFEICFRPANTTLANTYTYI